MPMFRMGVVTDIHYARACSHPKRRGELGAALLDAAVERFNRELRPDMVALLGDLVDEPEGPDTLECLEELRRIINRLEMPALVIPGNHDPRPDLFYQVMPQPEATVDVKGVRFLTFVDAEEPGWNAHRSAADLDRMWRARQGYKGPIVALQHVPVLPPGATDSPYGYTNIEAILAAMEAAFITLAVGGHYHKGTPPVRRGPSTYVCAKALCEAPFTISMIHIGQEIRVEQHVIE